MAEFSVLRKIVYHAHLLPNGQVLDPFTKGEVVIPDGGLSEFPTEEREIYLPSPEDLFPRHLIETVGGAL